ncbi:hypothetical protein [Halopiger xanaduensis]|uniref:Uncharacterized protein n=1 Tax=Halopiger xanaduensis (strain DSM 18323 / JCM 14033 / SH-6) TaxID=797210 RepID=F8D8R4_HALXS|nr:hypothetical protein [Halopiger xanaduensis]AEH36826.1 hypothetical protein Halxa_2201 [Halopiger xanaduensis SH-6]
MSEPDREPTKKPTNTKQEAKEEDQWMIRNWIGVAVVSIFGLLLLAVAMMQATGVMDVFGSVAETQTQQWGAFAVLALIWLALAGWSWKAISG